MITIHIWNENTAQAGEDAFRDRGGDSTEWGFASEAEARELVQALRKSTRIYDRRLASTIESYL